jgi:ankyrin repeat protein
MPNFARKSIMKNYLLLFILLIGCDMKTTNRKYIPEDYFGGVELPVAHAIYGDDKSELKKTLKQKTVDISKPGKEGYTFLLYAIKMQKYQMMEILLENGADPNVISPRTLIPEAGKQSKPSYTTCIQTVCYSTYDIKYLKLLVNYRANINENRDVSPLFRSIMSREKSKINFLLKNGANVNLIAETGTAPLITAANLSWFDLVEQFLDLGADPFLEDKGSSLRKSIQYYINRTEGTPEGRKKVRKLIKRLEERGMTFDFSKSKIKMTDE